MSGFDREKGGWGLPKLRQTLAFRSRYQEVPRQTIDANFLPLGDGHCQRIITDPANRSRPFLGRATDLRAVV